MHKHLVLTLTGKDKVGIVEEISELVLSNNGSVGESRMARLGGEFAVLMLVSVDDTFLGRLKDAFEDLKREGFKVTFVQTELNNVDKYKGWLPYKITVNGADHEGILHTISRYLADKKINIESMETHLRQAPWSGAPLFIMEAIVLAPPALKSGWKGDLKKIAEETAVDIDIAAYSG